jgi:hypothetical protein
LPVGATLAEEAAHHVSGPKRQAGSMITKYFCTYATKILRGKKILRDHGDALGRSLWSGVTRAVRCITGTLTADEVASLKNRLRQWAWWRWCRLSPVGSLQPFVQKDS